MGGQEEDDVKCQVASRRQTFEKNCNVYFRDLADYVADANAFSQTT